LLFHYMIIGGNDFRGVNSGGRVRVIREKTVWRPLRKVWIERPCISIRFPGHFYRSSHKLTCVEIL